MTTTTPRRERRAHDRPREQVKVHLEKMVHEGEAIGRVNGQIVFVSGGIPGEDATVELSERRSQYLRGRVVEVENPSPHRVTPSCQYYGMCGGCSLQHMDYQYQLDIKTGIVREQLERTGGFADPPVHPIIGMDDPWGYRNHGRFTTDHMGRLCYTYRRSYRLLPVDECLIMHPQINGALDHMNGKSRETQQVSLRYGINTGVWMIQPKMKEPAVELPTGQLYLEEELLGRRFRVSGASFFQVNTKQAERMIEIVRDKLAPRGTELLLDAYAGVGTFAILLAPYVDRVIAVEESPSAIEDAHWNVKQSGTPNVEVMLGKSEEILPKLDRRADAVILDPPRSGCHMKVLDVLIRTRPNKVIYVSCEPSTLARDLRVLVDGGYRLVDVQPLDMFPQTYHIESITTLEWNRGRARS